MELSDGVYLPFCLFSEGGGVKIVSDLISGGLRWSKIAFLPFVRQGGGVKISNLDLEVSDGFNCLFAFWFLSRRVKMVSNFRSGGLRWSKFAF